MVTRKTISVHTKQRITLDTFEPFASCPSLNTRDIAFSCDCGQASAYWDVRSVFRCYYLILRQQTSPFHTRNLTLHWGKL